MYSGPTKDSVNCKHTVTFSQLQTHNQMHVNTHKLQHAHMLVNAHSDD